MLHSIAKTETRLDWLRNKLTVVGRATAVVK
jgi:hypothetical protein